MAFRHKWALPLFQVFLILSAFLSWSLPARAQSGADGQLILPTLTASVGNSLSVPVSISLNSASRGIQLGLTFDPTVLRCDSIDPSNDIYHTWAVGNGASDLISRSPTCDNSSGTVTDLVHIITNGSGGAMGIGMVETVHFTVVSKGLSPLTLVDVMVADDSADLARQLDIALINGAIVVPWPPDGSPTPTTTPMESSTLTLIPPPPPTATMTPTDSPTPITMTQVSIAAHPATVVRGTVIDASLLLGTNQPSHGAQAELSFDPALLQCVWVEEGSFYTQWALAHALPDPFPSPPACDNAGGRVNGVTAALAGAPAGEGPTGLGSIVVVHFVALQAGTAPLDLQNVFVLDAGGADRSPSPLPLSVLSGQITIVEPTATPSPKPPPTSLPDSTPSMTSIPTRTLEITPTVTRIPSNASMSFNPASREVQVGDNFNLDVVISTDQPSRGAQADVSFDPDLLRCTAVDQGNFYSNWAYLHNSSTIMFPLPEIDNPSGTVSGTGVVIIGPPIPSGSSTAAGGPTGSGTFLRLHFTALSAGLAAVTLGQVVIANDNISWPSAYQVVVAGGQVLVGASPSPSPIPSSTPTAVPPAQTTGSGNTIVDAPVPAYLKISPPIQVTFPASMQPGPNVVAGILNVQCNTSYQVDVFDDQPTDWHLTEWDGSSFKDLRLTDPLRVQYPEQGTDVTAGTASSRLVSGDASGQSGDAGQDFPLNFIQSLHYSDPLLPAGEGYHLVLTFVGYITF